MVLLRKPKMERWPNLEASPATFNKVLSKMGVDGFQFVDVFDPSDIPSSAVVSNTALTREIASCCVAAHHHQHDHRHCPVPTGERCALRDCGEI